VPQGDPRRPEDDWAMGRVAKSGGRKFNDIAEHILNTDGDIEKFAALFDKRDEKHVKFVEARSAGCPVSFRPGRIRSRRCSPR
jgi:hypothetical protein